MVNYRRMRRHFVQSQQRAIAVAAAAHRALMARDHYSELKVLCSAAGYYVGTLFWDSEYQFYCPGSRDSGYFATEAEASAFLSYINA